MSLPKCPINFNHEVKENILFPKLKFFYCCDCQEDLAYLEKNPSHKAPQKKEEINLLKEFFPSVTQPEIHTHQITLTNLSVSNQSLIQDIMERALNISETEAHKLIVEANFNKKATIFKGSFKTCKNLINELEKDCSILESQFMHFTNLLNCFNLESI